MKTENTLSGIAMTIASLSAIDVLNSTLAIIVCITAIALNYRKYKSEKARHAKEISEKKLLDAQYKILKNEK